MILKDRANVQGHIDMVTEKNKEVQHDFFKDGIRLKRDGDWLKVRARSALLHALQERDCVLLLLHLLQDCQCLGARLQVNALLLLGAYILPPFRRQMGRPWEQVITLHLNQTICLCFFI